MCISQTVNGVQYDADNNIEIDRLGVQAGVGYGFGLARIGLTGGYEQAQGEGDGEFDAKGFNIGLYGQYGGLTGFHAEALFKYDSYDVEFGGLFDGNDVDGDSTGFELAEQLQAQWRRLPAVVLMSADADPGLRPRALERGWHYLPKPLKPAALRALAMRLLARGE